MRATDTQEMLTPHLLPRRAAPAHVQLSASAVHHHPAYDTCVSMHMACFESRAAGLGGRRMHVAGASMSGMALAGKSARGTYNRQAISHTTYMCAQHVPHLYCQSALRTLHAHVIHYSSDQTHQGPGHQNPTCNVGRSTTSPSQPPFCPPLQSLKQAPHKHTPIS